MVGERALITTVYSIRTLGFKYRVDILSELLAVAGVLLKKSLGIAGKEVAG